MVSSMVLVEILSFSACPVPAHPILHSPPYLPPKKKFFPGFGFFVKIYLTESLKLELYDLYFRSYSWMIIFFVWNMDYINTT